VTETNTTAPRPGRWRRGLRAAFCTLAGLVAGCASDGPPPAGPSPAESRALIARLLPPGTADRAGWATDIHAAFAAMSLPRTREHFCAVIAVTEQESGFRKDPAIPGLPAIAWREVERQADEAGVPMLVVRTALRLPSPNGRSFADRLDAARTEQDLSRLFEDFLGLVPLGRALFAGRNPVRTGGPMQVAIAFAEGHAKARPYPYPVADSLRAEVFTRRGGMYFGIAHLLDYPAGDGGWVYRFADFNAGHHASRNAALQNAIGIAAGVKLSLDGDLVRKDAGRDDPGETELAARTLADRLDLGTVAIRRALEHGDDAALAGTTLYQRVFALADQRAGHKLPRAMLPRIRLHGPKITRQLTTEWFARRVEERQQRCLGRGG
jgi:hypothetical protein